MSIDPLNRWEGNIHHQEVTYLGRGHTEISPPDVFLFEHISSVLRDQRMNRKPGRGGEEWLGKASLGRQSVELMDGGGGCTGGLWQSPRSNWNAYMADFLCWGCPWVNRLLKAQSCNWNGQYPDLQGEYTGPTSTQEEDMGSPEFSIPNFHYSSIS